VRKRRGMERMSDDDEDDERELEVAGIAKSVYRLGVKGAHNSAEGWSPHLPPFVRGGKSNLG